MNKQGERGIEWTRVYGRTGYTWNVVGGCLHNCEWFINGEVAGCYAKTIAERVARAAFPQGFEHHYFHPGRLSEPSKIKEPSGIFLDSMSDLMGHWVPSDEVQRVLDVCADNPQHIFFLLTKNSPRLPEFQFPANVWVGVSSPPDYMWGKKLTDDMKKRMLHKSLSVLHDIDATVTWMSFEPLSWDVSSIVAEHPNALQWAVIGAASNGRVEYPPKERHLTALLDVLDADGASVFYKGNLRSLPYARSNWREAFPVTPQAGDYEPVVFDAVPVQMSMF